MDTSGFVFWDSETTGLDKAFHVPVEIGGTVADVDLVPVRDFEFQSRPPRFVLPDPGALVTTGRSISELNDRQLSCYELIRRFAAELQDVTPTCFVTYNGVSFDDPLLQHTFYRNLHDPYSMMKGGNRRLDLLNVIRLAYALDVGELTVPTNDTGKPTFKLDHLATLNGFGEGRAHTASGDTRALLQLARFLRDRVPAVWQQGVEVWSRKDVVRDLLITNEVVILFEWNWRSGKPVFKALMPLSSGRGYAGEFLTLDLERDPSDYVSLSPEELVNEITIGTKRRPICPVRLNAVPIVFAINDPIVAGRLPRNIDTLLCRARQLRTDADLRDRILEAADLRRARFSDPEYPEQQLYSGGFISNDDMAVLTKFHCCEQSGRLAAVERIGDKRLQYFAARLMYEEWPAALPPAMKHQIDAELVRRLHAGLKAPWTTYATAQRDIDKLLPDATSRARAILLEYRDYIAAVSCTAQAAE